MKPRIKPPGLEFQKVKQILEKYKLYTVCQGAHCPNCSECWSSGTTTFMILGDTCTRACRFCSVNHGAKGQPLDLQEPARLAKAVKELKLKYVVITSVDRDDLPDKGAKHYGACIDALKRTGVIVEALIPDYQSKELKHVLNADVVGHNLETVRRLTPLVRDRRADYDKSLKTLETVKQLKNDIVVKTSLMLGLGETPDEVIDAVQDAADVGVDVITFGQYLRPTEKQLSVKEWVPEEQFADYARFASTLGMVALAGSRVRSSYKAKEAYAEVRHDN